MSYRIAPHLSFMVPWLRVLGVNVRLWKKEELLDPREVTLIQWARYPLPRRKGRDLPLITLTASSLPDLLKEFLDKARRRIAPEELFSRCLRCNTRLQTLAPDEVKTLWPELPEYVYRTQPRFHHCKTCGKFFWAGTHVENMRRTLAEWGILPIGEDQ